MKSDIVYNFIVCVPLPSTATYETLVSDGEDNDYNDMKELRRSLEDLLIGRWQIIESIYYSLEFDFWCCYVHVEDKEDVARIKMFRDCMVIG